LGASASDVEFDQISGDVVGMPSFPLTAPGTALQARTAHQHLYLVVSNDHTGAEGEFGVDATGAVDAVRVQMDLGDQVGQHRVPDRSLSGDSLEVLVVPGLRYAQDPAGDLSWVVLGGYHLDGRVTPCGRVSSLSNSIARRLTSSSASSAAMRFLAEASSAFSTVVRPG
jgi:hypothetical protein